MRIDITTRKARGGCAPPRRDGLAGADVAGDFVRGEEPDVDGGTGPFGGVDAAAGVVEAPAVGLGVFAADAAAAVGGLAAGVDVAVVCVEGAGEAGVFDGATVGGVQGHLILGLVVYAFDDVDFAIVGPVGAKHPAVVCQLGGCSFGVCFRVGWVGTNKAGQVPQVLLGMWARSRITRPCL